MEYILLQEKDVEVLRNYMTDTVYEGFAENESRFALCQIEGEKVIGVGVFDAFEDAAHIISIRVIEEYRGECDRRILSSIVDICNNLGCEGIYFEIYDEDDQEFWAPILVFEGFINEQTTEFYQIPMLEIYENTIIEKARISSHVISLKDAPAGALHSYGNQLIKKEEYDKFFESDYDTGSSSVYLNEDGDITACLLMRDLGPKEGFYVDYVNTSGCKDKTALIQLFKYTISKIRNYYDIETAYGYALDINNVTGTIIKKIFPGSEVIDHCNVYVHL